MIAFRTAKKFTGHYTSTSANSADPCYLCGEISLPKKQKGPASLPWKRGLQLNPIFLGN